MSGDHSDDVRRGAVDGFAEHGILSDERKVSAAARINPATFVVFDLLYDGAERTSEPLTERKALLQELIATRSEITPTMYAEGKGKALNASPRSETSRGLSPSRRTIGT